MSLFWNREDLCQILGEISNSKDSEEEEQNWWWYYGLSNIGSNENPVRSNIYSARPILQVKLKWKKLVGKENWILQLRAIKNCGKHDDK